MYCKNEINYVVLQYMHETNVETLIQISVNYGVSNVKSKAHEQNHERLNSNE